MPIAGVTASQYHPIVYPFPSTGLTCWYDASDATTVTGTTAVSQWNDKVGTRHLSQATGAKQPANTATQNGLKVMSFTGAQKLMSAITSGVGGSGPTAGMSIAAVFRKTGANNSYESVPFSTTNSNVNQPFDGHGTMRIPAAYLDGFPHINTRTSWTTWQAIMSTLAGGAVDYWEYFDGTLALTMNSGAHGWNSTNQYLCIGSRNDEVTQLTGDVAEVIVWSTNLGDTDRQAVQTYLKAKVGDAVIITDV